MHLKFYSIPVIIELFFFVLYLFPSFLLLPLATFHPICGAGILSLLFDLFPFFCLTSGQCKYAEIYMKFKILIREWQEHLRKLTNG
jgi:hypothetical protein